MKNASKARPRLPTKEVMWGQAAKDRRMSLVGKAIMLVPFQAARRSYRWWSPPTCGIATTAPISGCCTGRGSGVSLASERCVLDS
jgi:hypothetical protein